MINHFGTETYSLRVGKASHLEKSVNYPEPMQNHVGTWASIFEAWKMYSWHFTNQKNSIEKETKNTYLYLANKFRMLKKIKTFKLEHCEIFAKLLEK